MSTPSPSLWTRWKSLRLPWRRHILIGSDLSGNTFWEYLPPGVSKAARPRRILRPAKATHHSDVQVSPQWHQWLKQTRVDAPSIQEQLRDLQRIQELQVNARLADARWEAKARYIEKPKTEDAEVSAQRKTFGGMDGVKADGPTAVGGEMPRTEPESKENARPAVDTQIPKGTADPWKKAEETGQNPGAKWQPEAWTPGPKRR
jgi:NADH dehydrogenase [ubiquinone] 1 alpha subcomplex assembly factor 2